jgi:NAD(P)-dependent dehydrogenase (short-subunit alcohol dehydrogenase family)
VGSHTGRIAVVTGAGRGIGQEYAVALATDGATVVVADLDDDLAAETVKLIERAGGTAVARHLDVSDQSSAAEFGTLLRREFGTAHILVNNAAIYHSMRTDTQMEVDIGYWRKVFSVNLDGALLMTQAVAPLMIEGGWGRIVNQASTAAYSGTGGAYCVSKLALVGLTQGFARELGKHGITVNAIAPTVFRSKLTAWMYGDNELGQQTRARSLSRIPLGRLGEVEDLVGMAVYLLSPASDFCTGQIMYVDGGYTAG